MQSSVTPESELGLSGSKIEHIPGGRYRSPREHTKSGAVSESEAISNMRFRELEVTDGIYGHGSSGNL
jgi:hypothetical protein